MQIDRTQNTTNKSKNKYLETQLSIPPASPPVNHNSREVQSFIVLQIPKGWFQKPFVFKQF